MILHIVCFSWRRVWIEVRDCTLLLVVILLFGAVAVCTSLAYAAGTGIVALVRRLSTVAVSIGWLFGLMDTGVGMALH